MISQTLLAGVLYAVAGAFAGLMAGLMGIGGGVIMVPSLVIIFRHNPAIPQELCMQLAAGTSLAIMMFTSHASIRAHYRHGDILWVVYRRLVAGIGVGTILGGTLARFMPTDWLQMFLVIFLLTLAGRLFFDRNVVHLQRAPRAWLNTLISFLIGFKSGMLGLGGGILLIPYLTYWGLDMKKIVAVSALCTMTISILGTMVFIIAGMNAAGLPPWSTGYVSWLAVLCMAIPGCITAPVGARMAYVLPVKLLKQGFIVLLIITAASLLYD